MLAQAVEKNKADATKSVDLASGAKEAAKANETKATNLANSIKDPRQIDGAIANIDKYIADTKAELSKAQNAKTALKTSKSSADKTLKTAKDKLAKNVGSKDEAYVKDIENLVSQIPSSTAIVESENGISVILANLEKQKNRLIVEAERIKAEAEKKAKEEAEKAKAKADKKAEEEAKKKKEEAKKKPDVNLVTKTKVLTKVAKDGSLTAPITATMGVVNKLADITNLQLLNIEKLRPNLVPVKLHL